MPTTHLRTTPYAYQLECADEIDDFNGRSLVAMDPGLGKSLTSLLYLHRHPELHTTVVVCPASAKWVWQDECRKHLGAGCEILETRTPQYHLLRRSPRLWVINYDILKDWLDFLVKLKPHLLVFDECHALGDRNTKRTRAAQVLAKQVSHILALSGTPLVNRPAELWPVLNMLRPDKWPNFHRFAHKHCNARFIYGRWDYRGASRLKALNKELLRHCMVRRRKEEVLSQLPPKQRNVVPLPLSDYKEYDRAMTNFLGWLREKSPQKAAKATRAEGLTKVGYLLRLAARLKLAAVCDWVDNFLQTGNKLLLFGVHRHVLDVLEKRYRRISVRVDGSVVGWKRRRAFEQFNKLDRTRLLLGNIQAAGTAWSCTATSNVALVELPWSPGLVEQALDRAHGVERGVEGETTTGWFLVAHGTVEASMCKILQKKHKDISATLDGKRGSGELDLHSLLLKQLEREV